MYVSFAVVGHCWCEGWQGERVTRMNVRCRRFMLIFSSHLDVWWWCHVFVTMNLINWIIQWMITKKLIKWNFFYDFFLLIIPIIIMIPCYTALYLFFNSLIDLANDTQLWILDGWSLNNISSKLTCAKANNPAHGFSRLKTKTESVYSLDNLANIKLAL